MGYDELIDSDSGPHCYALPAVSVDSALSALAMAQSFAAVYESGLYLTVPHQNINTVLFPHLYARLDSGL